MVQPIDLRELFEARDGMPTEDQAARKIATFAVIPAAMVGLLASTQLVGLADPIGRLVWVCTGTALVSGFGIAFLVLGVYHLFGFRPVAVLADAMVGAFYGFFLGGALAMLLMSFKIAPRNFELFPLLLIPLGAVTVPIMQAWRKRTRGGKADDQSVESQIAEADDEPESPRTQDLNS